MPNTNADFAALIEAARRGVAPVPVPGLEGLAIYLPNADDGDGEVFDLERFQEQPRRKSGHVVVFDAASFNQMLRDNADAGDAVIFVDRNPEEPRIVAVLNHHGRNGPGWGDLRVSIDFQPTPQWVKWKWIDGKLIGQTEFAEFVEDNIADIAEPSGATMLEIATHFQATRSTAFRSAQRLSSGQVQFQNVENLEARVGASEIAVPESFVLALAPMHGGPVYRVPTRLRYRLADGVLKLGIKLQRLEDLMRDVIEDVVQKIEVGTNVSVIEGRAP